MTTTKRIKFNRASIDSTIGAAKRISETKTCYVFATCNGFVIDNSPAPFGGKCYKIENGNVEKFGKWSFN